MPGVQNREVYLSWVSVGPRMATKLRSGFRFNVLGNGLAAEIRGACDGIACSGHACEVRVPILIYVDDVVIFSDSPSDLQQALDAAAAWRGLGHLFVLLTHDKWQRCASVQVERKL